MEFSEPELVQALHAMGIPQELISRAVERGDPEGAIFDWMLLPTQAERRISAADIHASGGLGVEQVQALVEAYGMPPPAPDEPAFTPEEAHVFVELERLQDVWPDELATQLMRVYGRQLAQIAQSSVRLFRVHVERRLRAQGADRVVAAEAVRSAFESLVPLAEPMLVGVYRRWLEHELTQQVIRDVESRSDAALPGAVDVAFLFCDLKDFTAFAEVNGDEAAVAAIDRFVAVVSRERGDSCRFQKLLGDGVMLSYDRPADAVACGARIIDGMRGPGVPLVHASAHRGVAIVREGDYFGTTVNIAARVVARAAGDELLATRPIAKATAEQFSWEPAGPFRVRGINAPIALYRLSR